MEYTPGYICLKIKEYPSIAKCISILRKYNPSPMSEINVAIESNAYVLSYRYTSDSGIRKIRKCFDELSKNGIVAEIYEHDSLTTREFISNLLNTYHEIEQETQEMIDAEVAAEGECEDED